MCIKIRFRSVVAGGLLIIVFVDSQCLPRRLQKSVGQNEYRIHKFHVPTRWSFVGKL